MAFEDLFSSVHIKIGGQVSNQSYIKIVQFQLNIIKLCSCRTRYE